MSFFKKKPKKEIKKILKDLPNVLIVEQASQTPYPFSLNLEGLKVFVVNKKLIYEHASDIEELNLTSNELIGQQVLNVLPKDYALFFSNIYNYVLETCKTLRLHVMIGNKHHLIIANPLKNSGDIEGCILIRIPYSQVQNIPLSIFQIET